jgi:Rrf2 family protein
MERFPIIYVGKISMKISTKGRYSLEALLYLALLGKGKYASTREIAEQTGVSEGYLEQLFIPLRKKKIIRGIRGPAGGYLPGKDPAKIKVGDILRAVEGSLEPVDCVKSRTCPAEKYCISRHTWTELYAAIRDCVDSISLQDLCTVYESADSGSYVI